MHYKRKEIATREEDWENIKNLLILSVSISREK
jgi:hypothetical protein